VGISVQAVIWSELIVAIHALSVYSGFSQSTATPLLSLFAQNRKKEI